MTAGLLAVRNLSVRFGGIAALDSLSLELARGELTALIGPNGAGKTTLFNCLCRITACDSGEAEFDGRSLLRLPAHALCAAGIGRTFQTVSLFASLSVMDNILVGTHCLDRGGVLAQGLRTRSARDAEAAARAQTRALLARLGLEGLAQRRVAELPLAAQKRVELARALVTSPKLLLLDEPASGLAHGEVAALGDLLRQLRDKLGMTVLLIEHNLELVMRIAERVVVLDFGRKIAEGAPAEVRADPGVRRAYLGGEI